MLYETKFKSGFHIIIYDKRTFDKLDEFDFY